MTLFRQLLLFTLVLFILLFTGVWIEKLNSTRDFLTNQLATHAQDTAASLGLSISSVMADDDLVTAESMVQALFDHGYYREITMRDVDGEVLIQRVRDVQVAGVPAWFVERVSLEAPGRSSLIMSGWSQVGDIYVECHPGYAFTTLWQTTKRIFVYFIVAAVLVLLAGAVGLRVLLKPLWRVERQAEAICNWRYEVQERLPNTRELRQVVESMNKMVVQVRAMLGEQTRIADRLRQNVYSDPLTGLGNRRYLDGQFSAWLQGEDETVEGALLLLEVSELEEVNEQRGFAGGDALLCGVAEVMKNVAGDIGNVAIARVDGGNFAIFTPEISPDQARGLSDTLLNELGGLVEQGLTLTGRVASVGMVVYDRTCTLTNLLTEAGNAVREAEQLGPNRYKLVSLGDGDTMQVRDEQWWQRTLEAAIARQEIQLYAQNVVDLRDTGKIIQQEVFSRLVDESGEVISAAVFVPLAERLQITARLDMTMFKKVLDLTSAAPAGSVFAVNISVASLSDPTFFEWLVTELKQRSGVSIRYIFELPEQSAVNHLESVRHFLGAIRPLGHGVGLDHFGKSFVHFGYLKSLRPDYIKLDRGLVGEVDDETSDGHFFMSTLCGVASSLGIGVYGEGVEKHWQLQLMQTLNFEACQGYFIEKPRPFEAD